MLRMDAKRLGRGRPGADEIPHGFVTFIRNPHCGQFDGAQQPSQRKSIPAVCLHSIAGLPWDQRWRDHSAFMAQRSNCIWEQLTISAVA